MKDANRQSCCGCGIKPPRSGTNDSESSSLLSTTFGWRVIRRTETTGKCDVEWRCPACWETYKARRNGSLPAPRRRA